MGQAIGGLDEIRDRLRKRGENRTNVSTGMTSNNCSYQVRRNNDKADVNEQCATTAITTVDVTMQAPRRVGFPNTIYTNPFSLGSDEPSMSSSIIETTLAKDPIYYSIAGDAAGIVSKAIPKRVWSSYRLLHLNNIKSNQVSHSVKDNQVIIRSHKALATKKNTYRDMEQLMTMMQNHKVSDDTRSFGFNFTPIMTSNNNSIGSEASNCSSISSNSSSSSSSNNHIVMPLPESKFTFSANIPIIKSTFKEKPFSSGTNGHITSLDIQNRKILPLPKPRRRRSNPTLTDSSNDREYDPLSNSSSSNIVAPKGTGEDDNSSRDNTKKMKWSNDNNNNSNSTNKRKERSCMGYPTAITRTTVTDVVEIEKTFTSPSYLPPVLALTPAPVSVSTSSVILPTSKTEKKKTTTITNSTTKCDKKKQTKKAIKKKQNKEIAPGGFLSSDITLFENPISDDWICLFCQYDILFNGQAPRKK